MNLKPMILGLAAALALTLNAQTSDSNWPAWRGPNETGAALKGNPPAEFSETLNVRWKTRIPGKGHATPVVWGDNMIILTAVPTDKKSEGKVPEAGGMRVEAMSPTKTDLIHQFQVVLVDRKSGKILWAKTVREEVPVESTHQLGSWASNSPVTDGQRIYAYFGSRGLYCLDFKGNILWDKDFGQMQTVMSFGEGSSPALYKDKLVVTWDHEAGSFITVLDKKTGKEIWKMDRDEGTSWASPLVVEVNGKPQVVTAATKKVRSYDLETGNIIWECTGLTRNVIPNPVYGDGILYVMSGYRGNALFAIDIKRATGDITGTDVILWSYAQDTPYTPSPVLMDGLLYFLRANNGELTCLDAKTGAVKYAKQKVTGITNTYSSPTGAPGLIYVAGEKTVSVIQAGPEFKILSTNTLDDTFEASPIIIGDEVFFRGAEWLYCVGNSQ
jgi:outer membrane protein assembly factor BamB